MLLSEHEETGWTPARYEEYTRACAAASTDGVRLVPGIEFSQDGFHVLCYGLRSFPPRPSSAKDLSMAVRAHGRWLCLAHPGKYRWRHPPELVEAADAVEVWNSKWIYDGTLGPHPASLRLAKGLRLFAGQDVHKRKHFSSLYVETEGPDVLGDLAEGRYRIACGGETFTEARLRTNYTSQAAQLIRTEVLKGALVLHRLARGKHPFPHARSARKRRAAEAVWR